MSKLDGRFTPQWRIHINADSPSAASVIETGGACVVKLKFVQRVTAATIGIALAMAAPNAVFATAVDWRIAAQAEIDAFSAENPNDLSGIDALLVKHGLPPMKVSVSGVRGTLTGARAEKILTDMEKPSTASGTKRAVPTDAFGVWIAVNRDLYNNRIIVGNWNFRDNFVNGSAPDDVAAIQANLGDGCWRIRSGGLSYRVSDYTGAVQSGRLWVEDAGINGSPILGVRDRVSGFRLLVDNGYFRAQYERTTKSGCGSNPTFGGQFQYEHNQDGENGFSASASWGKFSVTYAAPCTKLRKSSDVVYF